MIKFHKCLRNIPLLFTPFNRLLLFLTPSLIIIFTACEPGGWPIIENQYHKEVDIYIIQFNNKGELSEPIYYGKVPGQAIKKLDGSVIVTYPSKIFRIEAIDNAGEKIFSKDFSGYELEEMKWKITIPP